MIRPEVVKYVCGTKPCISWLEWFWQQEIERAIWSVKQA